MLKGRVFLAVLPFFAPALSATFNVNISATPSHSIPSTLWGLMFEDISQSGDGGLYGELLQNRAFQQVTPGATAALNAWASLNGGAISVVASSTPVSKALPNSLSLSVPSGASGAVGFGNWGYWGIKVDSSWTYNASFYFRFPSPPSTPINSAFTIGLESTTTGTTFGSTTVNFTSSDAWSQVFVQLTPDASASTSLNNFTVTVDGAALAGQTIEFAMFSLFPPTFKDRPNGMRLDIAQTLADMKPAFFRFPGGNNLEGGSAATRWQWNNTVGSLLDRPGRQGDWGYVNTDGLGLLEYMEWIEDIGAVPIMAVWAGYSLDNRAIAEANLQPYIDQAIDQINFVIGDPATSKAAALRASLGHPEPFELKYVEIGNEDFISSAPGTYASYRWRDFVGNLSAVFPDLIYIATSNNGLSGPVLTPKAQSKDLHVYQTPSWFATNSFFYDNVARDGTIYFEGEYAAISTNPNNIFGSPSTGRIVFPTVAGAVGESAFMTGLERNSDIVFAASYAPLLNHVANSQWTPNLVSFTADSVIPSASYYVQKLFSVFKGDQYLPSTLPSSAGPVFWSAVQDTPNQQVFIKVSNTANNTNTVNFQLPFGTIAPDANGIVLTGAPGDNNNVQSPATVVPTDFTLPAGSSFSYVAPAQSFSVLIISAH